MKGIIFNQLEAMLGSVVGPDAWDELIESTQDQLVTKSGAFVGPKVYPDADLFALVGAASAKTGIPPHDLVRAFGKFLFPALASLYPTFLRPGMKAKAFLASVDRVIHVEVRKLHADADLPTLRYEDPGPDELVMLYTSPRKLCDLAKGLIEGVGAHFHESIAVRETECMKQGASHCRLECTFGPETEIA